MTSSPRSRDKENGAGKRAAEEPVGAAEGGHAGCVLKDTDANDRDLQQKRQRDVPHSSGLVKR
jgi:hypothetical protein